jgi:hypothetical protein
MDSLIAEMPRDVGYMFGDASALQSAAGSNDPDARFPAEITSGAVAAAEKDLAQLQQADTSLYLDLYLASLRAGNQAVADRSLQTALDKLSKGTWEEKQFAGAFNNPSIMPIDRLMKLRISVEQKVILLTALGLRQPALRPPTFALARKLNFNPRFPHLLLKAVLDSPGNP